MTSTVFADLTGPVVTAAWLNDVNNLVYGTSAIATFSKLTVGPPPSGYALTVVGTQGVAVLNGVTAAGLFLEFDASGTPVGYIGSGSSVASGATLSDFVIRSEGTLKFNAGGNPTYMSIAPAGNVTIAAPSSGTALTLGTVGASGAITVNGVAANILPVLVAAGTTTAAQYISLANTGGSTLLGTDYSTGIGILTGSTAYATIFGSQGSTALNLFTNSIVRLVIASTGNVTIAAPSSGTALTINSADYPTYNIQAGSTSKYAAIQLSNSGGTRKLELIYIGSAGSPVYGIAADAAGLNVGGANPFTISTNDTLRVTVGGAGNVTIAAPSSGATLSVTPIDGGTGIQISAATDARMYWYSAAVNYGIIQTTANLFNISGVGASTAVAISTNGVQRLSIASSGGFTIGAPSSGNALQITGSGGATSPLVLIGVAGQTGANFSTSTPSGTINFWRLGQSGVVNWDIQNIATTGVFALNNGSSNVISATTAGNVTIAPGVAITAGGSKVAGVSFTSTADFGVYTGSGAPSISAAKGSLYLRSDGTTTTSRAYINTDGATTWTAITTVA